MAGWYTADEIEYWHWRDEDKGERDRQVAENLRRFADIIRELDPKRRAFVNHAYVVPGGGPWLPAGSDMAYCSVGMTGIYNGYRIRELKAEARRLGFGGFFAVLQSRSVPRGEDNLRWYGYREPITDAVIDSRSEAQHVQDSVEIAYLEGAMGGVHFLYWAGGGNYLSMSLVDLNGNDYIGKWDAVREAARNIRTWEGAPSCSITSPTNHTWGTAPIEVTVEGTAPETDPVTAVKADYSIDGAYSWKPFPDAAGVPCTFTVDRSMLKQRPAMAHADARFVQPASNLTDGNAYSKAELGACEADYIVDLEGEQRVDEVVLRWGTYGTDGTFVTSWTLEGLRGDVWIGLGEGEVPGAQETRIPVDRKVSKLRVRASGVNWFGIHELSALVKDGEETENVALGKPVEVGGEKVAAPSTIRVRVRAFNKRGPSLWDVVQVQCNR